MVLSSCDKAEKYVLNVANRIDGVLDKLPINDTRFSVVASQSIYVWIIKKLKIDPVINAFRKEMGL